MKMLERFGLSNDNSVPHLWKTDDGRLVYGNCWDNEGEYLKEEDIECKIDISKMSDVIKNWYTNRWKLEHQNNKFESDKHTFRFTDDNGYKRSINESDVNIIFDYIVGNRTLNKIVKFEECNGIETCLWKNGHRYYYGKRKIDNSNIVYIRELHNIVLLDDRGKYQLKDYINGYDYLPGYCEVFIHDKQHFKYRNEYGSGHMIPIEHVKIIKEIIS